MSVSKTKRRLPPSNVKPKGDRNKRRAGLVKGAPMARGIFGLSVTGCHADYLPLPMRRTGVGTAQSHIEEKAARVTAIIDPVREMAPDRVRCGPGSESPGFSTSAFVASTKAPPGEDLLAGRWGTPTATS